MVMLPFTTQHAIRCGQLLAGFPRDANEDRVRVKDDFKLIAQCDIEGIDHILTDDHNTLTKYLIRANTAFVTPVEPILSQPAHRGWNPPGVGAD